MSREAGTVRRRVRLAVAIGVLLCVGVLASPAAAEESPFSALDALTSAAASAPTIASDQPDYAPGSSVRLSGSGWQPGEAVYVTVNDDVGRSWSHAADVTADADGRIVDEFALPDWFVASYAVVATGASGTATATFTDASLRVASAPAGVTFSLTSQGFTSSTCLTAVGGSNGNPSTVSVTGATPASISFGSAAFVKLTAGAASAPAGATFASWSGPSFSSTEASICVATPQGGNEVVFTANYTVPAGPANQTITFAAPSGKTYGDADFDPGATASSGLAVGYGSSTPGTCSIVGGLIRVLAAGTCTVTASQAGTASYNPAPDVTRSFTIGAKTIAGSFTTQSKVYDGTTAATIAGRSLSGVVGADAVSLTGGSAVFADENVGSGKAVSGTGFSLAGAAASNYELASTTIASVGTITAATVVAGFEAEDKVYDGTTAATIASRSLSGVLAGDIVTIGGGNAAFADASAGVDTQVTAGGFTLGGADAGNYELDASPVTAAATISPLGISGVFTAAGKVYDGDTAAEVLSRSLVGALDGDDVELTGGTAAFADASAGEDRTVTLTGGSLSGDDAVNYLLTGVAPAQASISRLGISGVFTAAGKVYDGDTAAEVLSRSLVGALDGDDVELTGGTAAFADASAGEDRTVTLTGGSLSGDDAVDYLLTGVAPAQASIAKKPLTATGPSPAATTYGDDVPALAPGYDGFVSGEGAAVLDSAPTCALVPAYHGAGSYAVHCSGGEDANYAFDYADGSLTVETKPLTGSFAAADKIYDGTTAASVTPALLAGLVGFDSVHLLATNAHFSDASAGDDLTVSADLGLGGADAPNYHLTSATGTALASIAKRDLTVTGPSPTAITYGDALPDLPPAYDGFVDGESAAALAVAPVCGLDPAYHGAGSYAVRCSGGADGNYAFGYVDGSLIVETKGLTGSFTAADKVYDGTTDASVTPAPLAGLVGSYDVELLATNAHFADENAGEGKTVTADLGLDGPDAVNYHLTSATGTAFAAITRKGLAIAGAHADSRDYDGTTAATVDFDAASLVAPLSGDDVSIDSSGYTAAFATSQAGAGKPVTVAGVVLAGADAGNYTVAQPSGLSAEIRRLAIGGRFTTPASKVYDGTTAAVVLTRFAHDVVAGDAVALTGGTASFDTKGAGTGKTVTLTGAALSGSDAGNYSLTGVATASADIVKAALTATAHDKQMLLNGAVPTLTYSITGYVAGESFGASSGVGGAPSCSTENGTAPGAFDIVCSVGTLAASNYSFQFVKGTLTVSYALSSCLGSAGHAILQPIDQDGSSVFRQGSTVPAKFRVCDARGVSIGMPGVVASFRLASTNVGVGGPIDEAVVSTTPDTAFRWSAADQQWIFNVSTKSLVANRTYYYEITLDDGSKIAFRFGLK